MALTLFDNNTNFHADRFVFLGSGKLSLSKEWWGGGMTLIQCISHTMPSVDVGPKPDADFWQPGSCH